MIKYSALKRLFDISVALISLIILSPVYITVYFFVLKKIGRPGLFAQIRPGLNEKPFKLYKFRTMTNAKDEKGNLLPDGRRLTPFGIFLRKTSIDELPEIFNIFKGDMSFVGPRPLLMKYLPYYTAREKLRHTIRPGLTGLAQISGRNALGWDKRLGLDAEYVENMCFRLDMLIFFKTIFKVLRSEDIAVNTGSIEPALNEERRRSCRDK